MKETGYRFLKELFLRSPYYSYLLYDLTRLPEVLKDAAFLNGLYLASPAFYRVLEAREFCFERLVDKEKLSLSKYYNRMCFRPVPFGSFASFTLLDWENSDRIVLEPRTSRLHLLPDQELLSGLSSLEKSAEKEKSVITNPTMYRLGKEFRYVKSVIDEKGKYNFQLDAIGVERFYISLLSYLKKGAVTKQDVILKIITQTGCSVDEALGYLDFLLEAQVLIGFSRGAIIGSVSSTNALLTQNLFEALSIINSVPFNECGSIANLAKRLEAIFATEGEATGRQYFYAALESVPAHARPETSLQDELSDALHVLKSLSLPLVNQPLKNFIKDFENKFDQQTVPLLLALDPDAGISYDGLASGTNGNDLPENLKFPGTNSKPVELPWSSIHQFLLNLWVGKGKENHYRQLTISGEDLDELDKKERKNTALPNTISLLYRKTEEHLLIEQAGGATATSIVGRFSAFSGDTAKLCRKVAMLEAEANPGVLFADIGQHSDNHVDNINRREQIYPFEIPLNVYSALDATCQISPADLQISVRSGELILQSARLKKRILPRLATAYNFHNNNLAIFRFLCDLQYQSLNSNLSFNLESFFPGLAFYPRVSFGHIVICLANWRFSAQDLACLTDRTSQDTITKKIRAFRKWHHLPKYISVGNSDQQLIFNLENGQEALFFVEYIRGKTEVKVQEYLLPDRTVKRGNKPLAAQFIAFLHHDNMVYSPAELIGKPVDAGAIRAFPLGSKWLYLKIYCTPSAADRILIQVIKPLLKRNNRHILSWFFIRYQDKGHHIRLRVHTNEEFVGSFLSALKTQLTLTGSDVLIKDYLGDTYKRELERYGADLIELVEEIFCCGSRLVFWYLNNKLKEGTSLTEIHFSIITAAKMMESFFEDSGIVLEFCERMTTSFLEEFKADKSFKLILDSNYRSEKEEIENLLGGFQKERRFDPNEIPLLKDLILKTKSMAVQVAHRPYQVRARFLSDLIHMQLNRTFQNEQRKQEMVTYYYLTKYLISSRARTNS